MLIPPSYFRLTGSCYPSPTLKSPVYLSDFLRTPGEAPDFRRAQHPQRKYLVETRQYRLNRRGWVEPHEENTGVETKGECREKVFEEGHGEALMPTNASLVSLYMHEHGQQKPLSKP